MIENFNRTDIIHFAVHVRNHVEKLLHAVDPLLTCVLNKGEIKDPEEPVGSASFIIIRYCVVRDGNPLPWKATISPTIHEIQGGMMVPAHTLELAEKILTQYGKYQAKLRERVLQQLSVLGKELQGKFDVVGMG